MYEQYQKKLEELLKESEGKSQKWLGWKKIEILEDIIAKYVIFAKTS